MAKHDSAAAALDALPAMARAAGIDDYAPCPGDIARREIDAGRRAGAWPLFLGEDAYPVALAAIADPPPVLWARGDRALLAQPIVAMVGSRNASSLGTRMARKLAEGLGWHGFAIVSGLARGIDAAVHGAALQTGTLAVLASGIDVIYPTENTALAAAIADQGLLLSEQPIGMQPQARHFPRRNRIVSGLAQAVVVIEAAEGSGSLITAREALDQGREVMAVPGHPLDARATGCNHLIREGARLVRSSADIVEALPDTRSHAGLALFDSDGPARPPRGNRSLQQPAGSNHMPRPDRATPRRQGSHPTMRPAGTSEHGSRTEKRTHAGPTREAAPAWTGHELTGSAGTRAARAPSADAETPWPAPPAAGIAPPGTATAPLRAPEAGVQASTPPLPDTLALHRLILDRLGAAPLAEDQLIRDLAMPAARIAPALLFLELDGRIQRQPGGMLARL